MAVTRLEVRSRQPYADGAAFGEAGTYEQIDGIVHFAVDPAHPANALAHARKYLILIGASTPQQKPRASCAVCAAEWFTDSGEPESRPL